MTVARKNKKASPEVQKLFETVALPKTRVTTKKILRPKKGTYYSKNLRILTPDIQDPFQNNKATPKISEVKKKKISFESLLTVNGIILLVLVLVIGFLFFRNIKLEKETSGLLEDYQSIDKEYYLLKEEADQYERRSGELENLNQYLLQKVSEQEKELQNLSYTVTEEVIKLQRQLKEEQEALLEMQGAIDAQKYDDLGNENKKAFHEYFFESYEKPEEEKDKPSKPFLLNRIFS